ncbi:MAG: glycoside hydrolase family 88 protein [Bacillota bacterium]|nr:glycoside hydrolase family 88 protein [Bacillota bacterium]
MDKTKIEKVKMAALAMQRDSWEQGVLSQALLELGDHEGALLLARDAVVRQGADGRLGLTYGSNTVTDPAANTEAVLFAAEFTKDPFYIKAASRMEDWLLNKAQRTDEGVLCHMLDTKQVWLDSLYMAVSGLGALGHYSEMMKQIKGIRKLLWDPTKRLFSHMWDDQSRTFIRKNFWGVGNGWAAAGMAKAYDFLPDGMKSEKELLKSHIIELLDSCITYQRPDGFFHDVLDDPQTFVETNLAQMLAYTIYKGILGGWLDKRYLNHADTMRTAANLKVDKCGLVLDVCGAPHFDRPGTAAEGQAFYLLMEAAADKLR